MRKIFIPLLTLLLVALCCYAVVSAEEFGGTYTMPGEVTVGADGKASFDIVMTPYDAGLYNGYQFHVVPGSGITIDSVSFSRSDLIWFQPVPTNPPDGRINFGITYFGTGEQNVITGPITCKVNISFTGAIPMNISFERKGDYSPDVVGIYKLFAEGSGSLISTPLDGPKSITILPYLWNRSIVTFYSNGGTDLDQIIVENGKPAAKPIDPTKTDFAFDGWYDNPAFTGTIYNFDTPVTDDINLYAKWTSVYTVTFYPNGGTPAPSEQKVNEGEKAFLPAEMSKPGFSFSGWYDNATLTGSTYNFDTPVTASLDLYAKWTPVYTVTFYSDGVLVPPAQKVIEGEMIAWVPTLTKEGFTFGGWYDNDTFTGAPYDLATPVTANLDLYAKWISIPSYPFTVQLVNSTNRTIKFNGQRTLASAFQVRANEENLILANIQGLCLAYDNTILQLIRWDASAAITEPDPGAVFDTPAFGAGNGGVLGSPINVFYALGEDSEIGYLSIAPGNSSATFACPLGEFVTLGEFRFAFRAGKSTADLTEDSIRIMAVEELYALRQTTAVLINTDRGISYRYGAQWNGLAMPQWDSLGKPAIIWELIKGVEISGIVKSYNPLNPIDIKLVQDGSIAYETTVAAAAWAGWDPLEQGFIFEDVIPGIYSLVITKAVHTKITVQTIVVADDDLDLSKDSRSEVQLMTMRCGDISNDGLVNDADLTILWRSGNYNKKVDEAENSLCDLNGDGLINDADLTILWLVYNYNRGEIIVP